MAISSIAEGEKTLLPGSKIQGNRNIELKTNQENFRKALQLVSPAWCHQFSGTSPSKYLPGKRIQADITNMHSGFTQSKNKLQTTFRLSFSPFIGEKHKLKMYLIYLLKEKNSSSVELSVGFVNFNIFLQCCDYMCVFVQYKCFMDDTLDTPISTHYPVCSTTVQVSDK